MPYIVTPTATTAASAIVAVNNVTRDGGVVEAMQLMNFGDGITGNAATVSASGIYIAASSANAVAQYIPATTGTWNYYSGSSGTINITAGQRILGITAYSTAGGTLTINGGASIIIAANTAVVFSPIGNLIAPTLVFSNTVSFIIEVVS